MLRGLYLSATGMVTQELRQEVISNNLANATTSGYKSETATLQTFPEMLLQRLAEGRATPVGYFSPGVMVDRIHTNFAPGPLEATGRTTDLALAQPGPAGTPPAFFTVQAGDTVAYTRNGSFRVDADGFLVTAEGYPVLGDYGAVYVGTASFKVDAGGQVLVDGQ
ncbi:MAG: flagellar hook-basal body complex protein, partial [Moorella sp. (in: Bacteria)]|nr:flagellar hook-basal body complex protein [Moorella sp. (in: firmicutes)]